MQTVLPSDEDLKKKLFHKQSVLISDQQKFPQLFKWKTATLILGALSAILLIVLLVVVYNIEAQGQVVVDMTFLARVASESNILENKQELINLGKNFQSIYGTIKFSHAQLIYRTGQLTSDKIRHEIYSQQNEKLLYVVEVQLTKEQTIYPVRFALFMNSAFPLPKDEDFNNQIKEYYSFEAKEERKSSLLSVYTEKSLQLYSTNPSITSITQCTNYNYVPENPKRKGQFRLLKELVGFSFSSPSVRFSTEGWKCFSPSMDSESDMQNMLKNMLNPDILDKDSSITLKNLEVYYLS